jgi:hypothetical protein
MFATAVFELICPDFADQNVLPMSLHIQEEITHCNEMNDTIFDIDTRLPMPFGLVIFTTLLGLGWVLPRVLALISYSIKECSPPSSSEAFVTCPIFVMKRTNSHSENR